MPKPTKKEVAKKSAPAKKAVTKKQVEPEIVDDEVLENDELGFSLRDYLNTYWYLVIGFIVIIAIIGAYIVWKPFRAEAPIVLHTNSVKTPEEPTTLPRLTDGVLVPAAEANQVPVCVMIENAAFGGVRPQAGLSSASIVYEVIVEGGITRYMAVFPTTGDNIAIGPVRSARDTYLEFASDLDCAYVHAGGSFSAMQAIPQFKLKDIDALRESKWFHRRSDKVSPHNLFTDREQLHDAITNGHSWTDPVTFESWKFVDAPDGEPNEHISIAIGGAYNAEYIYNVKKGAYDRSNSGVALTDENTDDQISVVNVIIEHVPPGVMLEEKGRINFSVTGEGKVDIFRHGLHTTGTWKKADRLSRTKYYDANGDEIELARGATWVHIVPEGYAVDFSAGSTIVSSATPAVTGDFATDETTIAD